MLSFEPNIIFIDDKEEEVDGIVKLYQKEGFGVKYYNADLTEGDEKPNEPFYDVNLIYLDLYYKNDFDVELCAGWIESLVPENTFYVLVIWSKDTQHSDEVIEDLVKLKRKPFLNILINKGDEYKKSDNDWDFDKLKQKIGNEVGKHHALEELSLWKKSIKCSSNVIVGHLSKDIEADGLNKKLKKIIIGHGGSSFISSDNKSQKRDVLFDALDNILISNAKGTRSSHKISNENKENLYVIESGITSDIDTMLNSWFHFKLNKSPLDQSQIMPGLICKYKDEKLKNSYTLLDDANIKKLLREQIERSEENDSNTRFEDVVLLLSRPCDIAQNKYGKNLKLISGAVVYNPKRKDNEKKEFKKSSTSLDSIKIYDHLCFTDTDKDVAIIFDFRYVFSVPKDIFISGFENIKYFNKELLSEIQVEYGSYSSRLGITQII